MRIFIASDIHGSSANAKRFFDIVSKQRERDDVQVVLLGDLYNHGPRNPFPEGYAPMKVAELFNANKHFMQVVKGNCDSEVDQMISEFEILPNLDTYFCGHHVLFTHGHKCNINLPKPISKQGDIVFYGHFHKPFIGEKDGVIYVCVGAIGLNPEGVDRAYCVLDEDSITIYSLIDGSVLCTHKF